MAAFRVELIELLQVLLLLVLVLVVEDENRFHDFFVEDAQVLCTTSQLLSVSSFEHIFVVVPLNFRLLIREQRLGMTLSL